MKNLIFNNSIVIESKKFLSNGRIIFRIFYSDTIKKGILFEDSESLNIFIEYLDGRVDLVTLSEKEFELILEENDPNKFSSYLRLLFFQENYKNN